MKKYFLFDGHKMTINPNGRNNLKDLLPMKKYIPKPHEKMTSEIIKIINILKTFWKEFGNVKDPRFIRNYSWIPQDILRYQKILKTKNRKKLIGKLKEKYENLR